MSILTPSKWPVRSPLPEILIAVAVTLTVGGLVGWITATSITTWYATLNKPWFNPPDAVFGPVWTTLYVLMGIAAGLVWDAGPERRDVRIALGWFAVQLMLNGAWALIFFGARLPAFALAEIVLLLIAIIACMFAFARVRKTCAWLMLPYAAWVSFAAILNAAIVALNQGV